MNPIIVSKFGGSSMGDAKTMDQCAAIVLNNPKIKLVAVSATYGTTNQLIQIGKLASVGNWEETQQEIIKLRERHQQIAKDLNAKEELIEKINELVDEALAISQGMSLLKESSKKALDRLMSIGERLSSRLFAHCLNRKNNTTEYFDVRKVLRTDHRYSHAEPQMAEIQALCNQHLNPKILNSPTIVVTQGFIGSTEDGFTTTIGRGGSDYSAAILAWAVDAELLEIWTDVPGIWTTDPRVVKEAQQISEITYSEAAELANFGAKILHPTTLIPAMEKNIPVFVGSTFEPQNPGTRISKELAHKPNIRGMAMRRKQTLITLSSFKMVQTHGFLKSVFDILAENKLSVDLVTTSEVSVSLTLNNQELFTPEIEAKLREFTEVRLEPNLSLITIVGNNVTQTSGLAAKAFNSIKDFNLRTISFGASRHNLCFLVSDADANTILHRLHHELLENTH